jgi:membrane fusion protein, copper/silver efflux system
MKHAGYVAIALILVAMAFGAGTWWSSSRMPAEVSGQRRVLYFSCPMHPQYHSDHAGDCPSCGMRLEPVYAESGLRTPADGQEAGVPAGAVQVSAQRQQIIGVRLGVAERVSGMRSLRTTGRVVPNENAVYPLVAGSEGWVREVRGATTGAVVNRNDVLLSFYSPDFANLQQSYYSGLETLERVTSDQIPTYNQGRVGEGVERFANALRNLGVSEQQLDEMRKSRTLVQYINVVSPIDGYVLGRNASAGLRFDRGFEFYRIADLTRLWILADVYENQLPYIRPGKTARVTAAQQNARFEARVSGAEPIFDEAARTLKVRLDTGNPGSVLKPGMFVDVEFAIDLPASLAVPAEAVVDSGLRKTVFVDRGGGFFEARQVETGWRIGDQIEITKGLMPGERIVISGTFLIDSESRMKSAAQGGLGASVKDPVCGMEIDQKRAAAAGRRSEYKGATYYFCADECKKQFDAEPARFAGR